MEHYMYSGVCLKCGRSFRVHTEGEYAPLTFIFIKRCAYCNQDEVELKLLRPNRR